MRLSLILNRNAGTLRTLDADLTAEALSTIFEAHGHSVDVVTSEGPEVIGAVERACRDESFDAVVVGGGDGTISASAALASQHGKTLGVLPLGTMNLFARSLGLPLEMRAAADALAGGEEVNVDIAEVNGRLFVHHVTVGLHARMILLRRGLSYRSRLGKMKASTQAWWMALRDPPRIEATIRIDGKELVRRTAAILVSNNQLGEGHIPYADDPSEGRLGVYVSNSLRWQDLFALAVRVALGHVRANPLLDTWAAREVDVFIGKTKVSASVDGEIVALEPPLRCRQHRGGLRVLVPGDLPQARRQGTLV